MDNPYAKYKPSTDDNPYAKYASKPTEASPKPESAASDVVKTVASMPVRFIGGVGMALPNLVNQAVAGPQYLGRGIASGADKLLGVQEQPRGEIWQPYYGSEDVLQKLPESVRPHTPTTLAGQAVDVAGNVATQALAPKAAKFAESKLPQIKEAATNLVKDQGSVGNWGYRPRPIDATRKVMSTVGTAYNKAAKPIIQPVARSLLDDGEGGLKKALESPTAKEGKRLEKELGVKFSAAELTGNPKAIGVEDYLANTARHGDKFAAANEQKTNTMVTKFKETLNKIFPEVTSREGTGDKLTTAYKTTIKDLVNTRRAQANADANAADLQVKGKPVIAPTNFVKTLNKFVQESKSPTATPAQREAGKQAEEMIRNLTEKPQAVAAVKPTTIQEFQNQQTQATVVPKYKKITVRDLQNGLQTYGEGAYSGKGIWKKLDTASDRRFSVEAKQALEADLDAASETVGTATGLRNFRDNYRANSAKISDIEQSTIGKIVGGADRDSEGNLVIKPEVIADKFSKMEPTELRNTLSFLDKTHPDVANMARRYVLEQSLKSAIEGQGQRGAGTSKPFAKAEFVKSLPDDDKLAALLGNHKSAKEVKDVASGMDRLIDWGVKKNSATAARLNFENALRFGKGLLYKSVMSDTWAEDMLNPQTRKAMLAEVNSTKPTAGYEPKFRDVAQSLGMSFKDFMKTQVPF